VSGFSVADAECFTLALAKICGLTVAEVKVVDIGGKSVMMIRRFDRYWQRPGAAVGGGVALYETLPGAGLEEQRLA
jgi:serine/threonine-protein kinase HipA